MKKLNRKGFTLVELLAVIVILAIVVGITLVTVLPTLKNSREKAFQLSADTVADYYDKQYQLYSIGETSSFSSEEIKKFGTDQQVDYKASGVKEANYDAGTFRIDTSTGRVCVILTRSTDGEYYDAVGTQGNGTTKSSGC